MIAFVIAVIIAARLTGITSGIGAARFARAPTRRQLAALGAWRHPGTGRYMPPSKSVTCRVLESVDPAEIEAVPKRWSVPRRGDRRRRKAHPGREPLRGRTPRDRDPRRPRQRPARRVPGIQRRRRREGGGAGAAGEVPLAGRVITVDALHTTGNTARSIVETHGADHLMTVKRNAPETFGMLGTIDRERDATGTFEEEWVKAHGRIERRRIRTMTPLPGMINHQHVAQVFRVERERAKPEPGEERKSRYTYGITSVPEGRGTPELLLGWNRGHWTIENINHRARDVNFGEDVCPGRKGQAPINNATCNDIALALMLGRSPDIAGMTRHFALHRGEAVGAIPSPD